MAHQHMLKLIIFLILFIGVVFFSLPPVVTYDSAHYHTYIPIFQGIEPWTAWDPARGAVFPALIYFFQVIFGNNGRGMLLGMWGFYAATAFFGFLITKRAVTDASTRITVAFILFFTYFMDRYVHIYSHLLLTEFVAATLFAISIYAIWNWLEASFEPTNRRVWRTVLFSGLVFGTLSCIAYHLKQIFVSVVFFPLISAFCMTFFSVESWKSRLLRATTVVTAFSSIVLSVVLWNQFLPQEVTASRADRMSDAVLSERILIGLSYWNVKDPIVKNGGCSRLLVPATVEPSLALESVRIEMECDSNQKIHTKAALIAAMQALIAEPLLTIKGYWHSYLEILNVMSVPHLMYADEENDAFGNMVFLPKGATWGNWSGIPDAWIPFIHPYREVTPAAPSFVSKLPLMLTRKTSLYLFSAGMLIFGFFWIVIPLLYFFKKSKSIIRNPKYFVFSQVVFASSFSVFFHNFSHAVLGSAIDRYAFPAYVISNLILTLLLGIGINRIGMKIRSFCSR
jgi:hypothetical protein